MDPDSSVLRLFQDSSSGSFFGLPFEIRSQVYVWTTEHIGNLGCTKILSLCSQTYAEAIWWFRNKRTACLTITGREKEIFRAPKDFGMPGRFIPGHFMRYKPPASRIVAPKYSKLQMKRMHKVALAIVLPDDYIGLAIGRDSPATDRAQMIRSNLDEVARVLQQSDLKCLEITFWYDQPNGETRPSIMLQLLVRAIVKIATRPHFMRRVGLNEMAAVKRTLPQPLSYIRTFVSWIIDCGLNVDLSMDPHLLDHNDFPVLGSPIDDWYTHKPALSSSLALQVATGSDFTWTNYRQIEHQLVPECRTCLEPFHTKTALLAHLDKHPRHKRGFVRKRWNRLHPILTQHNGPRVCWTCAKSYCSLDSLKTHLDVCGHRRNGIIPRYAEDNDWYDWKNRPRQNSKRS